MTKKEPVFCENCGLVRQATVLQESKLTINGVQPKRYSVCPFCTFREDVMRNMERLAQQLGLAEGPLPATAVAEAEAIVKGGEE